MHKRSLDYDECKKIAQNYENRTKFALGDRSAYDKCRKIGWLGDFFNGSSEKDLLEENLRLRGKIEKQAKVIELLYDRLKNGKKKKEKDSDHNLFVVCDGDWLGSSAYSFAYTSRKDLNKFMVNHPSQDYETIYSFKVKDARSGAICFNRTIKELFLAFLDMRDHLSPTGGLKKVSGRVKMSRGWQKIERSYDKWGYLL